MERVFDPTRLVARARRDVVGLERESEVLAVAIAAGRHVVLEGPPGIGKSTLLRSLADEAGVGLAFVEGNVELTPARLVGTHDPAMVLSAGYVPEAFLAGPLAVALREGKLLYIEELNRVPEETLNVLITALAEGELHIPRVGRIVADERFRLIAAMNPFDAVGTARIGQAIYDRLCRIAIGYQSEANEREIVKRATAGRGTDAGTCVSVVRATRVHPDLYTGSSVRGAIDMALMAAGLRALRLVPEQTVVTVADRRVLLDAANASLSGRVRLDDSCERSVEGVIEEIVDAVLAQHGEKREAAEPPSDSTDATDETPLPAAGKGVAPVRG